MHTLKKFIQYYAPYKKVFFLDLICAAVISLVDLAFPQILRTLTKTLFTESSDVILWALLPDYTRVACYVYDPDWMQVLC